MKAIAPELLFYTFDLVVHTSHGPNPSFPPRLPIRSQTKAHDSVQGCLFVRDEEYPKFPSGITSHETNPHTPLDLSHVCKQWRSMVLAESNLWSTIYVTNGKEGFDRLLGFWLERSGSRPLKIVFRDSGNQYIEEREVVVAMLGLAAAHSRRWKSFKIMMRCMVLPSHGVWDALKHVDTPNLRELAFHFNGFLPSELASEYQSFDDMFMERWAKLTRSPRLREIQMWSTMDHDPALLLSIPFHRLAVVTLHKVWIMTGDRFVENLSQCTSLHTLSISLIVCEKQSSERYALSLPSLRNLDVIGYSRTHVRAFLQVFNLPALRRLSIHANTLSLLPGGLALIHALDHWKPKLHSLALRAERNSQFDPAFASLLYHSALKTLRCLRIGGIRTPNLFYLLNIDPADVSPMPRLRYIHIETVRLHCDYEAPTRMALSWPRLRGVPLLVEVDFLEEEDLVRAAEFWDRYPDASLKRADRKFRWIGTGERRLEREFMICDFSMIQGHPLIPDD